MNLDEIRELIAIMKANQLDEIDWESGGEHIRIKAASQAPAVVYAPQPMAMPVALPGVAPAAAAQAGAGPSAGADTGAAPPPPDKGVVIRSPIVGVYYGQPSPDKPPFVDVGQVIDENTVICIIEAMKVMNEIKAEMAGTVREVLVKNNQSVEFGQPLIVVEPKE